MHPENIALLAQLVDSMHKSLEDLEEAYRKGKKAELEHSKEAILEFKSKIDYLLR